MKALIISLAFYSFILPCFSQNTGEFKVSLEYTRNKYSMEQLNNFLLDTMYNGTSAGYFKSAPTEVIKNGNNLGISILYQPINFLNVGIYGGYQFGKIQRHAQFEVIVDPFTSETETINGELTYVASSLVSGLTIETLLDEIFFDISNPFWERASWIIATQGGVGFSLFRDKTVWTGEESIVQIQNYNYNSLDFHGRISMNFEYILNKSPLITSLGIKAGYQFLKTKNIKNDAGDIIINTNDEVRLKLDFSGVFVGAYINIGK